MVGRRISEIEKVEAFIQSCRKVASQRQQGTHEWIEVIFVIDQAQKTYKKAKGHYYPPTIIWEI
jgi:hypothetical protein